MTGVAREIELKFEIAPEEVPRLEAHPGLESVVATREIESLNSIYFDTDDFKLQAAGVTLRVREVGGRRVQTIKTADRGMFDRAEWESEIGGEEPELALAKGTALEPVMKGLDQRLKPVFATRIRRALYRVAQDGAAIELALDQGLIDAAASQAQVCEVELELRQGDLADLFQLARSLIETVPLRLSVKAKSERGYSLLRQGDAWPVERAFDIRLDPGLPSGEAFKLIARNCQRQLLANVPALCVGNEDALHQARIGLRRLRAALALFAPVVAGSGRDAIKHDLQWITRELGPARDLDVLIKHLSRGGDSAAPQPGAIDDTLSALKAKRDWAYARAAAMTRSQRFCLASLDIAEWIEAGDWTTAADHLSARERPVVDFAASVLATRRKRVRKRGRKLGELDARQRHKLRIQAKTLRYGIEFFASLFPGKSNEERRGAALCSLKQLQDVLGELNDIAVRKTLLEDGAGEKAAAFDAHRDAPRVEKLIEGAKRSHAAFAEVKSFWKV